MDHQEIRITGLTAQQVQAARLSGKVNIMPDSSQKTVKDIIIENVFTYFNFIFLVLSILLIAAGAFRSLTIAGAAIFNSLIGIVQQLRAKKELDKLSILSSVKVDVIRDGKISRVSTEDLVLGDVVIFRSGSQICADAVVVDGEISVNESLLTGESDEIPKKHGSKLLSGSFVVTGECLARLTHVGADSYVARLEAEAKEMSGSEQSEMVRGINRFVLIAGIAIVPIGIMLFVQGHMNGYSFSANVTSMVAAVVGMIPEGLYVLVTVTLAVSTVGLSRKKVLLHDMKSIETLARVDVLCVDKTGTITENDMVVEEAALPPGRSEEEREGIQRILMEYLAAQKDDNATMLAMRKHFLPEGQGPAGVSGAVHPIQVLPFSSKYKYSAAVFPSGSFLPVKYDEDAGYTGQGGSLSEGYQGSSLPEGHQSGEIFVMGAPDILLASTYERWREVIEGYSRRGIRVLVFAQVWGDLFDAGISACRVEPLLFIALKNPIREGAIDTFRYFTEQGVTVKVISGDNPVTVANIAGQAGIPNADRAIDATRCRDEDEIFDAVDSYTVFARVTPDRKQEIVKALQKAGHTVAMTGDGVNDIMAMKMADCSVAMASGSEAAVQASQVVLLDSDFSHMPQIVAEGRRVIGNIERSATLFLCKNIFSMLLAIFSIINVLSYPLQPEQIALVSWFNIGIPAFLLAVEPNERRIRGHFMWRVLLKALPAAITDFVLIAALMIFGIVFGVSQSDISVASTFLLAVVGFMILYYISRPMTRYRVFVMLACIVGLLVGAYVFHDWFGITTVSKKCMMLFVVFTAATEPFMRYLTELSGLIERKLLNEKSDRT